MTQGRGSLPRRHRPLSVGGLDGKTAVLLGASSDYGGATARMLALEGVNLALGGRNRERLEALEEGIWVSGRAR